MARITTLAEAVSQVVRDGDTVAFEGFTHLIPFAAAHEVIRQGRRDLTLVRMTPDLDLRPAHRRRLRPQAGVLLGRQPRRRLAAPLPRRGPERLARPWRSRSTATPGMANRYVAAASGCPFAVLRGYAGHRPARPHDQRPGRSPARSPARSSPPCRRSTPTPPSSTPSAPTARATCSSGASPACRRRPRWPPGASLVTVEEIVDELSPAPARSCCPRGRSPRWPWCPAARIPSYAQGYYERDNDYYRPGTRSAATASASRRWLDEEIVRRRAGSDGMSRAARRDRRDRRRDDDRVRGARAARRRGLLRGHRPAQHRGQPRPPHARPGPGADLRVGHASAPSRSRLPAVHRGRRCWPTTADSVVTVPGDLQLLAPARAGSTSASSARRRSTASRNINTTVIGGDYAAPEGAAARAPAGRRRSPPRAGEVIVDACGRARGPSSSASTSSPPSATARARATASGSGLRGGGPGHGDHRPRRARARPADVRAHADRLHPGVDPDQAVAATGWPLRVAETCARTATPGRTSSSACAQLTSCRRLRRDGCGCRRNRAATAPRRTADSGCRRTGARTTAPPAAPAIPRIRRPPGCARPSRPLRAPAARPDRGDRAAARRGPGGRGRTTTSPASTRASRSASASWSRGRVLDGDGRPVPNTLVEVWQANAAGPLRARRRPAPRAARPELHRRGPVRDRRRGPLPLRDHQARRLPVAQPPQRLAAGAHPLLAVRPGVHAAAGDPDVLPRATRCSRRTRSSTRCPTSAPASGWCRAFDLGRHRARVGARAIALDIVLRGREATPFEDAEDARVTLPRHPVADRRAVLPPVRCPGPTGPTSSPEGTPGA